MKMKISLFFSFSQPHSCASLSRPRADRVAPSLTLDAAMDTYTSEMDDALACVDALISKIPPEDTAPPLARDENAPPVVETGKAARRRGGLSSEAQGQLDAAKAAFDELLAGRQVGLRLEQADLHRMQDLVSLDRLDELRALQADARERDEPFFPLKSFFPPDGYDLLVKHHLTSAAYSLFDKHVRAWPGCFTARVELDPDAKKKHGFEHCRTKVVLTKVLAPLEAREAATRTERSA